MVRGKEAFDWFAPVQFTKGVGPQLAQRLAKLGIVRQGDLLLHFPYRYENHTQLTPIACVQDKQEALIQGEVVAIRQMGRSKKRQLIGLQDKSGYCDILFFQGFSSAVAWQKGQTIRCFGQMKWTDKGRQMAHPQWQLVPLTEALPLPNTLTPIYPTVAGLAQKVLRRIIANTLERYADDKKHRDDPLESLKFLNEPLLSGHAALQSIHHPTPDFDMEKLLAKEHHAFRRVIIEEGIAHYQVLSQLRESIARETSPSMSLDEAALQAFLARLPFQLTEAQCLAWQAIRNDLAQTKPMLRLVQGDVGCGKTVVGALATLAAVLAKHQVAIMAPTEILAEQHLQHFQNWLEPFGIRCEALTGKLKTKERRLIEENVANGVIHVVIGTHALFQESIHYASLGLVIIDEQHRFGVDQRLTLRDKGKDDKACMVPHQLIMTATPIPRTLAMSHYAHLDISTIHALPPGRQEIKTMVIPQNRRAEVIERINTLCAQQQQVYWVCTLISESEALQCQAAEVTYEELKQALPQWQIGLIHGKLAPEAKEAIMQKFYQGEIHVLVATTVIEVGVNVPNATLMVIENPERLGLAQLHQLRGRVGRGSLSSYCILLFQSPLSEMAQSRLSTMRSTNDGFVIAEADLMLRGPGEILGTKQTGAISYKILDLKRDQEIIQTLPGWLRQLEPSCQEYFSQLSLRWIVDPNYIYA